MVDSIGCFFMLDFSSVTLCKFIVGESERIEKLTYLCNFAASIVGLSNSEVELLNKCIINSENNSAEASKENAGKKIFEIRSFQKRYHISTKRMLIKVGKGDFADIIIDIFAPNPKKPWGFDENAEYYNEVSEKINELILLNKIDMVSMSGEIIGFDVWLYAWLKFLKRQSVELVRENRVVDKINSLFDLYSVDDSLKKWDRITRVKYGFFTERKFMRHFERTLSIAQRFSG